MQYDILGVEGEHSVYGEDWLGALGQALETLGLRRESLARLVIDVGRGGEVRVSDPSSGLSFQLAPVEELFGGPIEPEPTLVPLAEEAPLSTAEVSRRVSALPERRPHDLARALADIARRAQRGTTAGLACVGAIEGLRELIPCESGAVLIAEGSELVFHTATGPVAAAVRGTRLPADSGVAGFTYQLSLGVLINRADLDLRHDKTVDRMANHHTRSIVSAPLKGLGGDTVGVLQLINAPVVFRDWHLEAVQGVARDLAALLEGMD